MMPAIRHILGGETKWSDLLAFLIETAPDTAAGLLGLQTAASYKAIVQRESRAPVKDAAEDHNQVDMVIAFYRDGSSSPELAIIECKLLADFAVNQLEGYELAHQSAPHRLVIAPFDDFLLTREQRVKWRSSSWREVLSTFAQARHPVVQQLAADWLQYCDEMFATASDETIWGAADVLPEAKLAYLGRAIKETEWLESVRQGPTASGFPMLEYLSYQMPQDAAQSIRVQLQTARRDRSPSNPLEVRICLRTHTQDYTSYDLAALKETAAAVFEGKVNWKTRGGKWYSSWELDGYFRRSFRALDIPPEWTYGYVYPNLVEFGGCYEFPLTATLRDVAETTSQMLGMMDEVANRCTEVSA